MPYKVKITRDLCIGAGSCEAIAPKTFKLDDEGKSVIIKKDGTTANDAHYKDIDDTDENIMNAAKSCPTNAIAIIEVDEEGNEIRQVWPS